MDREEVKTGVANYLRKIASDIEAGYISPLEVEYQLVSLDSDERRVILHYRINGEEEKHRIAVCKMLFQRNI